MNVMRFGWGLAAGLMLGALTSLAEAGCNCGVPPAPAPMNGAPMAWPAPAPQVMSPGGYSGSAYGDVLMNQYGNGAAGMVGGGTWAPGGYESRVGSPAYNHDPAGGHYQNNGNPYEDHFGPGFQRNSMHGHYRFPYYNYRAPWYFPGRAVYNKDTNFAW